MPRRETGNHVLDELLAQSVQVGRGSGSEPAKRRRSPAPAERSPWPDLIPEDSDVPEVRAPAGSQGARLSASSVLEQETQSVRGPLALHLSRAATEEKLAEAYERADRLEQSLADAGERLTEARERLRDAECRLAEREGREQALDEELQRLRAEQAGSARQMLALKERIHMTEESEKHARDEQGRALAIADERRQTIESLRSRAEEMRAELAAERLARAQADAEISRLRGSIRAIGPLVSGLERATSALESEPYRAPKIAPAQPVRPLGLRSPEQAPASVAEPEADVKPLNPPRLTSAPQPAPREGGAGALSAEAAAERPANPGLLRVLSEAADNWQGPGPRPQDPQD